MRRALCLGVVLALGFIVLPGVSSAAPPELLTRIPPDGTSGSDAGRLDGSHGIAASPINGHIYVTERLNFRISEFTAWGVFVKAWGWGVANGEAKPQTCGPGATPPTATCLQGIGGGGAGQIRMPLGVATDSSGDVYVSEKAEINQADGEDNLRVQKFDPAGNFLLMFGGEVNKTKVADPGSTEAERNLCTAASGDECGAGVRGTGSGQFANRSYGTYITVSPADTVYVGDKNRIQTFDTDGAFTGEIAFSTIHALNNSFPEQGYIDGLAFDAKTSSLYLDFPRVPYDNEKDLHPNVYRLNPATGEVLGILEAKQPGRLATDPAGNVYVIEDPFFGFGFPEIEPRVIEFDATGKAVIGSDEEFDIPFDNTFHLGMVANSACGGVVDLYVSHFHDGEDKSYLNVYGPPPDPTVCPPPKFPPSIEDQFAVSVDSDGALVKAAINPHFQSDTTYYVEYGTGKCSEGGCALRPAPPGTPLGGKPVNAAFDTGGIFLGDLQPDTTYHYRFVAQSSGGGPVKGEGGEVGADGAEATFTTQALTKPRETVCPANQAFRTAGSAFLPDCRAYEMVSPIDKANGDVIALGNVDSVPTALNQSSLDGEKLTYSSYRAYADPQGAAFTNQYIATRSAGGWANEAITPSRGTTVIGILDSIDLEFRAFSPDLCQGWLMHDTDPPLAPGAVEGYANLYRRDNCGGGSYEAITRVAPPANPGGRYVFSLQGASAATGRVFFRARENLTPEGTPSPPGSASFAQLYVFSGGELHFVCILPDGTPSKEACAAGTVNRDEIIRTPSLYGAVSEDGSRVYWAAGGGNDGGKLYLRENPDQPQSALSAGKCSEAEKACTFAVSESIAQFWGAAADGSRALFTTGGSLYQFAAKNKKSTLIAKEAAGVLGVSEDGSLFYFASKEAITGEEENGEGEKAKAGAPNLYLFDANKTGAARYRFLATLSGADLKNANVQRLSPLNPMPFMHTAHVSPDGLHLAFMSKGELTGYDNTDLSSGEPAAEVFLYDALASEGAGELRCVSCQPSGARPAGREIKEEEALEGDPFWAAAKIPGWETQLYAPHVLSEDGQRLYFESYEALVPRDANGKKDVYQWEAPGLGDCTEESGAFVEGAGGCIDLISAGNSASDSDFLDASPSGSDVFFTTQASLLPQDPALVDVYDARTGGGFPPPPSPPPACEGDACQSAAPPPEDPTPASAAFRGPGDPSAGPKPRPRCPKGRRKVPKGGISSAAPCRKGPAASRRRAARHIRVGL
jgi:DNA-binding beta-propeller fold protein YncE